MAEDDMGWPEYYEAKPSFRDRVTRGMERGASSSYGASVIRGGNGLPTPEEWPLVMAQEQATYPGSCSFCGRVLAVASPTRFCPHCPPSGPLGAE